MSGDLSGESTAYYRDIETSVGPEIGPVEVLRVNHHGSAYSSNWAFLAALSPLASVISCGKNDYGHPSYEALNRLRSYGPVYQTADRNGRPVNGDIIITSDGRRFVINGDTFDCKVGVEEEQHTPHASRITPYDGPTVVRGVLRLAAGLCPKSALLDTAGLKVMELESGTNDLTGLAPGVYFLVVRSAAVNGRQRLVLMR